MLLARFKETPTMKLTPEQRQHFDEHGYLFFTSAPEGQDGCGHINCQSKAFWMLKFTERNLEFDAVLTAVVYQKWKRLGAPNYICDNLLVFKR